MREIYIKLKERVKERIPTGDYALFNGDDLSVRRKAVLRAAREVVWEEGFVLNPPEMQEMLDKLLDEIFGLGPLEILLRDEEITEIMVNGPERIFIEREGRILPAPIVLDGEEEVYRIIDRIIGPLGLHVDEASPYVDARLPGGSRVNVILPPLSLLGPLITIRKFRRLPYTVEELVSSGTLSAGEAAFLSEAVQEKSSLVICGGTGTGKTSLLNALSSFIGENERVITLEDAAELRLQQPHVIPLETRPPNLEGRGEITLRDLLRNALRMRPDRIIIGEVRGPEALDLLQALNTGHRGSMTTIHANSPYDALSRLETMALTAGVGLPSQAIREQIVSAVDILIHLERNAGGKRRVREISIMNRSDGSNACLLPAPVGDGKGTPINQERGDNTTCTTESSFSRREVKVASAATTPW
jgi:pilus assembly protein CpaF